MFTQNYYDFNERYNLDGTFLDLLKDNVYLIDGKIYFLGSIITDYKNNIAIAIKENYGIEVEFKEIQQFDNLTIYKVVNASQ